MLPGRYEAVEDMGQTPFHYGSHYSNAGTVLHYMVRVEPFTQLFLELQGGRLDFADRSFHSLEQTWRLSSEISMSDVKEMIPEFFYLPALLLNSNSVNFGVGDVPLLQMGRFYVSGEGQSGALQGRTGSGLPHGIVVGVVKTVLYR